MQNKPIETGIVHLWDLPEDLIFVGLDKNFQIEMIRTLKKSYKCLTSVASKINKHPQLFYNIGRNRKIRLDLLWKISELLTEKGFKEYSKENIEKNVRLLGTKRGDVYIYNPKLPFNFNTEAGAYFISGILFDGGIDQEMKPHYGNIHYLMRKRIKDSVVSIFGGMDHKELNPKRGYFVRFSRVIGILLHHCFNIDIGKKVHNDTKIPKFVFNYSNKLKYVFLKQAFDDDGTISVEKRMIRITNSSDVKKADYETITNCSVRIIKDLKEILESIDIHPNTITLNKKYILRTEYRKKGPFYRQNWGFSITGRENLERFNKNIGFNLQYKQNRLRKLLDNYQSIQRRKGEINKLALKKGIAIQDRYGFMTANQLAKELNITYRYAARIIERLLKENKIKVAKQKKWKGLGGGSQPIEYIVVK